MEQEENIKRKLSPFLSATAPVSAYHVYDPEFTPHYSLQVA
jgi:hypothetical protein